MHVVVTGGTGFIGRYVCEELTRRGHEVEALCRSLDLERFHNFDQAIRLGDVRDYTTVSEAMAHADGWIHLAGVLGTQETIDDPWPAIETNMLGAYNVLEAAAKYDLPGVNIAVGNWWMNNPYSITKNLAERFCLMYRDERGVPVSVVRALNAYGPRQSIAAPFGPSKVRKIAPAFICRALTGQPIEVYGDGQQIMDMAYVADVASVLVNAFEQTATDGPLREVIDAGTGDATTVLDVAEAVNACVENPVDVVHLPMRPGEPPHSTVLAQGTQNVLKERVKFRKLDEGMAETVEWFRKEWLPGYEAANK